MKIVQINTFPNKSTGTIMMNIHKELLAQGHESYVVWGRGRKADNKYEICINDKFGTYFHGIYTRLTDKTGFASSSATKKLLNELDRINPDIVHLHNIHGYYINVELLFNYLKEKKIKVIWTLHDCWAFTGHCYNPECVNCNKWIDCCNNCPQKKVYPKSFIDNSKWNYEKKKKLFNGLDLTIVTPSEWLANLVKQSFLKNNKIVIINNSINLNIFKKISEKEKKNYFKKFNLDENKRIILGVASEWTKLKGFDDFIDLSKIIDNNKFQIVMVGLTKKQMKDIPNNIIGFERTDCVEDLVGLYNIASVFFNASYAENYPTVNLEAQACGTPVVAYDVGGTRETIIDGNGIIIDKKDYDSLFVYVNNLYEISINLVLDRLMYLNYIDLYKVV